MPKETSETGALQLAGFLLALLFAYTWALPLRDIYGLDVRNALMAREMLEEGMTLIPRAMGQFYPDYPPLYFWLETLFSIPFGRMTTFSAVLPSALSAVGLVGLTYYLGSRVNRRVGRLAAGILATAPSFWHEAGSATIDMLLAFTVMATITALYCRDNSRQPRKRAFYLSLAVLFWVLAFFTKGPIGIVLPAAAWGGYLLLEKRVKDLLLFALLAVFVAIACAGGELLIAWRQGGVELVGEMIQMQLTSRVGQKENKPIYYYFIGLLGVGGPWILWCFPALKRLLEEWRSGVGFHPFRAVRTQHLVVKLSLVWFCAVFAIFTAASTKHGRYILPLFPPLSILLALAVDRVLAAGGPTRERLWNRLLAVIPPLLAGGAMGFLLTFQPMRPSPLQLTLSIIWFGTALTGWVLVMRMTNPARRIVALLALTLAVGLSGFNVVAQPLISQKASGRSFVDAVENSVSSAYPVVIYGLGRDGDGLKYALYSTRKPESIIFLAEPEEIQRLPRPIIIVAYERNWDQLRAVIAPEKTRRLGGGSIRSKAVVGYLLGP